MGSHGTIYRHAELYDLAFSYRDYPAECDFLLEVAQRAIGRDVRNYLELACGPANHAIELAGRGVHATALDRTPGMIAYAREKARTAGRDVTFVMADMERFELPDRRFDLASCLLVSCSYLLDNDAVLHHLDRVADHLVDDGVYVLELVHPRDVLTANMSTLSTWTMQRDGTRVEVTWGQPDDPYDPITQIRRTTVEIRVEDANGPRTFWETSPQREFTANEVDLLVRASGRFRVVATFGAPDANVPFDNDKRAWRMVPVLQKIR